MFSILSLVVASTLGVAEDYSITVNSLGIGNTWTSGVVTPLQVTISSNVNEATAAWVQWEVPDADGDTVLWGKPITLSPGGKTSVWLYAPIQPWSNPSMSCGPVGASASITSRRPPNAPTGIPPPMILPRQVRSGTTP